MTQNSELVLNFLKKNYGSEFSKKQIAETLGISVPAVTGSMNALIKGGYATTTREEEVEVTPATETRKAQMKKVLYHTLTEAGLTYDPAAVEAARLAEKEAAKAARAAEREAKKAAKEQAE